MFTKELNLIYTTLLYTTMPMFSFFTQRDVAVSKPQWLNWEGLSVTTARLI